MRTTITHLPVQIQNDLRYITTFLLGQTNEIHLRLQNGARIRYIVLHGCFTEDQWQPDTELRPAEVSYRYNLIVIISKNLPEIHACLQEAVKQLNTSDKVSFPVSILVDTHGQINRKLGDGFLAYDQIQARGIRFYRRGSCRPILFPQPEQQTAEKHYVQARDHFDYSFPLAQSFLSGARFFQDKQDRNAAAFMLNIAAVQAYAAFMAVHVLKYSDRRRVHELRELAESIHPELNIVWSGSRAEPCFDLLSTAFGGVRFGIEYKITDNELGLMFSHVEDLHNLVHYICKLKFEELKAGSLARPGKDWVEIISEGLKNPEAPAIETQEDEEKSEVLEVLSDNDISTEDNISAIKTPDAEVLATEPVEEVDPANPDPRPFYRTAKQEQALKQLGNILFNLENPCCELETIADVMRCLAWEGGELEHRGVSLMGQVFRDRATHVKDSFYQMMDLLRESQTHDDAPAKEERAEISTP